MPDALIFPPESLQLKVAEVEPLGQVPLQDIVRYDVTSMLAVGAAHVRLTELLEPVPVLDAAEVVQTTVTVSVTLDPLPIV